jgi:hypothetical protein
MRIPQMGAKTARKTIAILHPAAIRGASVERGFREEEIDGDASGWKIGQLTPNA